MEDLIQFIVYGAIGIIINIVLIMLLHQDDCLENFNSIRLSLIYSIIFITIMTFFAGIHYEKQQTHSFMEQVYLSEKMIERVDNNSYRNVSLPASIFNEYIRHKKEK